MTTVSTRSSNRLSRSMSGPEPSPEKNSVTSSAGSRKGKEEAVVITPLIDTGKVEEALLEEEGEPEIDVDISDTLTINGFDMSSIASEKPDLDDNISREEPAIRLVFGKKRNSPGLDDERAEEEKQEMEDDVKGDGGKRAPRKKRKWLKKGEGKDLNLAAKFVADPDQWIRMIR